jgi:hypothetical protein
MSMNRIVIADKEYALSPLSFNDMGQLEREAEAAAMGRADAHIARMDRLKIGTDADRMAVLAAAIEQVNSGEAEQEYLRGFAGRSLVLWLSARRLVPGLTLEEFRRQCQGKEHCKFAELVSEVAGAKAEQNAEPRTIPAHEKYKEVDAQVDLRTRIFNGICAAENITPEQLRAMESPRQVELFCKYAGVRGCDSEKVKERIAEYCQANQGEDEGEAGAAVMAPPKPNKPLAGAAVAVEAVAGGAVAVEAVAGGGQA